MKTIIILSTLLFSLNAYSWAISNGTPAPSYECHVGVGCRVIEEPSEPQDECHIDIGCTNYERPTSENNCGGWGCRDSASSTSTSTINSNTSSANTKSSTDFDLSKTYWICYEGDDGCINFEPNKRPLIRLNTEKTYWQCQNYDSGCYEVEAKDIF